MQLQLKSNRWYLRLFYWILDATIHSTYLVVREIARKKRAESTKEHPWAKYNGRDGRCHFQRDLALELIEMGIKG